MNKFELIMRISVTCNDEDNIDFNGVRFQVLDENNEEVVIEDPSIFASLSKDVMKRLLEAEAE